MITLTDVRKVYRTTDVETAALEKVSLTIEEGEFVAIMGPSGCGKSTLLNILGLIDRPTSGRYLLAGQDVSAMAESQLVKIRKEKLGFVFQAFNLIDELSVYQNIELPLLYRRLPAAGLLGLPVQGAPALLRRTPCRPGRSPTDRKSPRR